MDDKTETLTIRVIETVQYADTIEVTPELLDEAERVGRARTVRGVLHMLESDPDHWAVVEAADPANFEGVLERSTEGV